MLLIIKSSAVTKHESWPSIKQTNNKIISIDSENNEDESILENKVNDYSTEYFQKNTM